MPFHACLHGFNGRELTFTQTLLPQDLVYTIDLDALIYVSSCLGHTQGYMKLLPMANWLWSIRTDNGLSHDCGVWGIRRLSQIPNYCLLFRDHASINIFFPALCLKVNGWWMNTPRRKLESLWYNNVLRPALSTLLDPEALASFPLRLDHTDTISRSKNGSWSFHAGIPVSILPQLTSLLRSACDQEG